MRYTVTIYYPDGSVKEYRTKAEIFLHKPGQVDFEDEATLDRIITSLPFVVRKYFA